jgi:hypothetical protein
MEKVNTYLKGLTAIEIMKHIHSDTVEKIILDLQDSINDYLSYKESSSKQEIRLSEKEMFEINKDVLEKTGYVTSLLQFHLDYFVTSGKLKELCIYYGINRN